jgi:hypothetical protein
MKAKPKCKLHTATKAIVKCRMDKRIRSCKKLGINHNSDQRARSKTINILTAINERIAKTLVNNPVFMVYSICLRCWEFCHNGWNEQLTILLIMKSVLDLDKHKEEVIGSFIVDLLIPLRDA